MLPRELQVSAWKALCYCLSLLPPPAMPHLLSPTLSPLPSPVHDYREHYNPFVPYLKLLGGFFSTILTILWILHIILYMLFDVRAASGTLSCVASCVAMASCVSRAVWFASHSTGWLQPYITTFLNKFLIFFDGFFPLFGTLSVSWLPRDFHTSAPQVLSRRVHDPDFSFSPVAWQVGVFGLYLLMCAAKGNFKFGARFLLISIHPMELGCVPLLARDGACSRLMDHLPLMFPFCPLAPLSVLCTFGFWISLSLILARRFAG